MRRRWGKYMTAAELTFAIDWVFFAGLLMAFCAKGVVIAGQKYVRGRRERILKSGRVVTGTVLAKRYAGGPTAIRRVPHLTVEFSTDGEKHVTDQVVEDDAYFHYEIGDQVEILVSDRDASHFIPVISLR